MLLVIYILCKFEVYNRNNLLVITADTISVFIYYFQEYHCIVFHIFWRKITQ